VLLLRWLFFSELASLETARVSANDHDSVLGLLLQPYSCTLTAAAAAAAWSVLP
jgi:hypothetical protein